MLPVVLAFVTFLNVVGFDLGRNKIYIIAHEEFS
jgi:hypothetical protein